MLITNTKECPLQEAFKLISTRFIWLITLNLCRRVLFSYQHVEKDFSKLAATINVCHNWKSWILLDETTHWYEIPKVQRRYENDVVHFSHHEILQLFILKMQVVFDYFREHQQTDAGSLRWQWANDHPNWVPFRGKSKKQWKEFSKYD